jgi:hypothetical protein
MVHVRGYIERGTVRVGDNLELVSSSGTNGQLESRRGECMGVGTLSQPNQADTQRRLVGVLVSGSKRRMSVQEMCYKSLTVTRSANEQAAASRLIQHPMGYEDGCQRS